ncbi:pentapeptide repeat-containing protein [Salmonirosea aquatica]|uniref:Pentapeptide repeat-containing protein n=1 Tax=Salmonirosea aquatica TaxID=2654236 RepID=A0A7C9F357_9BACT|nr:pentapeptide repeat-containing protein [Cytophagaceae bacterium SJW1-29]
MKTNRTLLAITALFLSITSWTLAQSSLDARDIIQKIDKKQEVQYSNAVIRGTLDLTELANQKRVNNAKLSTEEYKSRVEVPLTFRNCTFKGDIIAYKTLDRDGKSRSNWLGSDQILYTADFKEKVIFENCTFEGKTEFKYSEFAEMAVFNDNKFRNEANFKYADFREDARFEGSDFSRSANFKYADFRSAALFANARINDYADFKYAEFDNGASFLKTRFNGSADFKYAEFARQGDFSGADFRSNPDFKYTKGRRTM